MEDCLTSLVFINIIKKYYNIIINYNKNNVIVSLFVK